MNEKQLIADMRKLAFELDTKGKAARASKTASYKAPEWFAAASALRTAADGVEYAFA